jgi:hypothetical protein
MTLVAPLDGFVISPAARVQGQATLSPGLSLTSSNDDSVFTPHRLRQSTATSFWSLVLIILLEALHLEVHRRRHRFHQGASYLAFWTLLYLFTVLIGS